MPHLVKWNDELSPFGLMIIAPHVQKAESDAIVAKSKAMRLNFSVMEGGGIKGSDFSGIPHSFIFDHAGGLVYEGQPTAEAEKKMRVAVGQALVDRTEKSTFTKSVQPLVDALKKGISPKLVLQKAVTLQKTDADAKVLVEAMTRDGKEQLEAAEENPDKIFVYSLASRLAGIYKGTPVGIKANDVSTKLKADKFVQQELAARPKLETLQRLDAAIEQSAANNKAIKEFDPTSKEVHKIYAVQIRQIKTTVTDMRTKMPTAESTIEAVAIAEKYGILLK